MSILTFLSAAVASTSDTITFDKANPSWRSELELDGFKLKGVQYHRCCKIVSQVIGKRKREPRSIAYKDSKFGEKLLRLHDAREVYYCYICERKKKVQELPLLAGTRGALDHLLDKHQIDQQGNSVALIVEASQQQLPEHGSIFTAVTTYDYAEFRRLLVRWIVYCFVAFRMLENDYFRELMQFLNAGVAMLLPKAASTIRLWVMAEYETHKAGVKKELQASLSNIHLSFDLWTSPNYYAILRIYGHFISAEGERCNRLLAFRRVHGGHSGENQALLVLEVIQEYSIERPVGFFVGDNAQSNDTCVAAIIKRLYPQLKKKHALGRRLRCIGHITNLCAQAMLLGKGAGKAVAELARKAAKGADGVIETFWRGRGAVGRLHNIVRYIRGSPQRREVFASMKNSKKLADFDGLNVSATSSELGGELRVSCTCWR